MPSDDLIPEGSPHTRCNLVFVNYTLYNKNVFDLNRTHIVLPSGNMNTHNVNIIYN
jgi:hypothetical protein